MRRRRLAALVVSGTMALTTAGCAGGSDDSSDPDSAYLPTGSPSVTVTMIDPPADYSEVEGDGFTISAPGEFQQQHKTSSNGEPMLVLEKPSQVPALPQRVVVIRDVAPATPAAEQSFALESAKAAGGPEGEVQRIALPAQGEGADQAFLVTWKEMRATADGDQVQVTYWQLLQQVGDDLILNVVALAPTDEFETSEVSKILRTFVVDDSSSA
ncbi:hypothetical protein [Nocardioides sp. T2.26MG-1]|uniref:hypothetical protein n=1 Tax=Nocardioides sp. T2.26MG-1 TaxID=3041166 RepID=UPI00247744A2|nr:hypothetical protein [Nocardioides sp. T2.26MG-1]CAI9415463.1 hypothetical protein HIDPHFAB_02527 [Nocardioides sp. T2.26MG-1]